MSIVIDAQGQPIENVFAVVDDEAQIPAGPALITPARLLGTDPGALAAQGGPIGVVVNPTDDVTSLAPHLPRLALVAITFPRFTDGRGYSQARILREELGFTGALRAVGDVLYDQLFIMRRCGFDQFELHAEVAATLDARAFATFSDAYQPAADARPGITFDPSRAAP